MKNILLILSCLYSLSACSQAKKPAKASEKHFGKVINAKNAVDGDKIVALLTKGESLEDVLNFDNETVKGLKGKVSGTVESVCQKKGCWMNLTTASGQEFFVRFKDYGFFVPKDLPGKTVVLKGNAFREITSIDELKHYAEDEGQSKEEIEAITSPREEFKFYAEGVVIID